jgi:hypothetical protein
VVNFPGKNCRFCLDKESIMTIKLVRNSLKIWLLSYSLYSFSHAEVIVSTGSSDSHLEPHLSVERREEWGRTFHYLRAEFPEVPGLVCDFWCFETAGVEFASAETLSGGGLAMIHDWEGRDWRIRTEARPEPGAVELVATLTPRSSTVAGEPEAYPPLNVCWQLRGASAFRSAPEPYPKFIERCFLFSEEGRTFLPDTVRHPIPVQPLDHEYNNPPWVQMYAHVDAGEVRSGTTSWAAYSDTRYTLPIIGAVSRDGKFLAALASGSLNVLSQAWHDCMHNNPDWLLDRQRGKKSWRIKVYAITNDPDVLVSRFLGDFPELETR